MFDATGTIGSLACEISLNKILSEKNNTILIKKIIKLLQRTKHRVKQLDYIPDASVREYFRIILQQDAEKTLSNITGLPVRGVPVTDLVVSHTMCCLCAYFKESRT